MRMLRLVAALTMAGSLVLSLGAASSGAPVAAAAGGTTTITLRLPDCGGCWVRAVNNRSDADVRFVGRRAPVTNGAVVMQVPTASTVGMAFDITAPEQGEGDADWGWDWAGFVFVAIQHEGVAPGTQPTYAQAAAAGRASPCWTGTTEPAVTLEVRVRIVSALTLGLNDSDNSDWVPVPTPAAWLVPTQAALPPFWEPVKGALVANEAPDCEVRSALPADGRVVAQVKDGGYASDVAIGPRGLFGYTASSSGVQPISLRTSTAMALIPGSAADGIAFSPDGRRAYTNAWFANGLRVIDLRTKRVIRTYPTPGRVGPPVVSPDGRRLYARVRGQRAIGIFSAGNGRLIGEVPVPGSGDIAALTLSPDGRTAYVLRGGRTLSAIDVVAGRVAASTSLTRGGADVTATAVAVTPDGGRLLLASPSSSVVFALAVPTFQELAAWPMQGSPSDIAINAQGTRAYAATYGIQTINLTTGAVLGRLDLPRPTSRAEQDNVRRQKVVALAVSPDGRTLLATTDTRWTFRIEVAP